MSAYSWPLTPLPGAYRLGHPARRSASLAESDFLPRGAYTTMRTVGGTGVLGWTAHLDRLEESSRLMGSPQRLERPALQLLLCQLLRSLPWAGDQESRVRLTLAAEHGAPLWVSAEPLTTPDETVYREGVAVLVRPMARDNARAKDSAFIARSADLRALRGGRLNEVLMVGPEGTVLEGIDSNFFAVRDGTLLTAEEGVLAGVTRSLVLEAAEQAEIPIVREALSQHELVSLDEAFLSSTSRGILPVTEIEGRRVGDGSPGPLTRELMARYRARIARETTELCEQ